MREMKDSGIEWIGEIPREWDVIRFKECFLERSAGAWGEEPKNDINDVICIRVADFDYPKMTIKEKEDYTYRNYKLGTIEKLLLKKGDILIEKSGGGELTPVGRTIIYNHDFPALYANFIERVRCTEEIIPKFMQYNFVAFYKNEFCKLYIKQTTGIQNLNITGMFANESCVFVDISTQQRIADYLDENCSEIDETIEKTKSTIEEYKRLKQSVITETVTKGLNPDVEMKYSGVEWIGEIPKHWETKKTKYLSQISRGLFSHRPRNDPEFYDGDFPFIQTGDVAKAGKYINIFSQTLNDKGVSVSKQFPKGTLTMTIAANVGDVAILNFDAYFPDSIIGFVPYSTCNGNYLYYIFSSMKDEFVRTAIVSTQLNLNIERVKEMFVSFVSNLEEQQAIAEYLDQKCAEIDSLIVKKQTIITELESYKKSLIYECVTGKVEV